MPESSVRSDTTGASLSVIDTPKAAGLLVLGALAFLILARKGLRPVLAS